MTIRVNVRCKVNNSKIRHEKRDGRDHIIVPAATLPDNIVMNGGLYPADEIEKGYKSLEGTPAPMGHPMVNGQFVSARSPEAINRNWVGAWNENVRREDGRVKLDKVIDVEVANRSEDGRALLEAINKQEAIHTSTGLNLDKKTAVNADGYNWIATKMEFDHDCFLLNQAGAAQPNQGVGVFVNSQGEQVEVINSDLTDAIEMDMQGAARYLIESAQRLESAKTNEGLINRVIDAIRGIVKSDKPAVSAVNQKEDETMAVSDEQFKALSDKVDALTSNIEQLDLTAINKKVDALVANQAESEKAAKTALVTKVVNSGLLDEETASGMEINALTKLAGTAEKMPLVNKVVKAGLLDENEAKALDVNTLTKLAEKAEPGQAFGMSGHFQSNASGDEWKADDMPGEAS